MNKFPVDDLGIKFGKFKNGFTYRVANHSRNFFLEGWKKQGWTDGGFSNWRPKRIKDGKRILVKTGKMRQSLRILKYNNGSFTATLIVDPINEKGIRYASIHNYGEMNMPVRKFMDKSKTLDAQVERMLIAELDKVFK